MCLFKIMHQMLIFGRILEIIRVIHMFHFHSVFKRLLNIPLLRLFNNSGAIWVYLNLVHMNSMA
jgi:hypothetical protein